MYELMDAREHGQDIDRPLLIVERYRVGSCDQLRRVFALPAEMQTEAENIVSALNDPVRRLEEKDLSHAA